MDGRIFLTLVESQMQVSWRFLDRPLGNRSIREVRCQLDGFMPNIFCAYKRSRHLPRRRAFSSTYMSELEVCICAAISRQQHVIKEGSNILLDGNRWALDNMAR